MKLLKWELRFRTQEEKEQAKKELEEELDIFKKWKNLELFLGSLEEFNKYKKEQYEIIGGMVNYGTTWEHSVRERTKLIPMGCTALIHFIPVHSYTHFGYGTPIRKVR